MDRKILEKLGEGVGVKSTCRHFKVGKDRVRTVRAKGIEFQYLNEDGVSFGSVKIPPSPENVFPNFVDKRNLKTSETDKVLLKKKDWIVDRLTAQWSPVTVFEELKNPDIGRSSFYRFLARHELEKSNKSAIKISGPIIHTPGEALILDWGKLKDVLDKKTGEIRTLWAFVGVMGFSRYMMIRLVWTNSVDVTMDAIESMLQEIGGVPRRLTSDNPKCFATKADKYDPILNPSFERLASHYDFRIECLPPQDPKKKGKVERMVPYSRRLFEAFNTDNFQLEYAQGYIDKKCVIANERRHGTTDLKPIEVFLTEEASQLKPLPSLCYEKEEIAYPVVRKDGFVRFANKYYAVSDEHVNKEGVVLGSKSRVSIYINGVLVETYNRITDKYQTHAIQDHLRKPWQKVEENNKGYINQAKRIGPHCEALIKTLILRGEGFVDTRILWGILALEKKKYPTDLIEQACADAYRLGKFSSKYIEKIILDFLKQKHLKEKLESTKPLATKYTGQGAEYGRHIENLANKKTDPTTIH
jgi:hypothetical protein